MDSHLQHDPRTKQQIKEAIYSFLYNPVLRNFQRKLEVLITKNSVLLGNAEMAFRYKGETYATPGAVASWRTNKLHKSLFVYMDEYLGEIQQLNNYEIPYVLGFINQVLSSSNDLQDYLLVFPPSLHPPIEQLINSCPCRTHKLTLDDIHKIQDKNQIPINLLKQRQVINLIV